MGGVADRLSRARCRSPPARSLVDRRSAPRQRAPVGYPPAAGGVLDLEAAWRAAQERLLGLPEGRADTVARLCWTLDEANLGRLAALPIEARTRMVERPSAAGGPAATLLMGAAAAGRGSDAFAVGLVCRVVFAGGQPQDDLRELAVRLEPLLGGQRVDAEAGAALAEAARGMLMRLEPEDSACTCRPGPGCCIAHRGPCRAACWAEPRTRRRIGGTHA